MSLQPLPTVRIVVTDTNILINFIHIGRLNLLGKLPPYSFVVPEEVVKEVTSSDQAQALQTAISSGLLQVVQLTVPAELKVYADLAQLPVFPDAAMAQVEAHLLKMMFESPDSCGLLHNRGGTAKPPTHLPRHP